MLVQHTVGSYGHEFLVRVPDDADEPTPAILYLHGRGESGTDLDKLAHHGLLRAADAHPERWPFLIIVPQKTDPHQLWPWYRHLVDEVLHETERHYAVHPTKRYLTGLSQGGNGTFELARHLSWRFAAVVPICGWCDPIKAQYELNRTPVWAFHGAKDEVILPSASRVAIEFLQHTGSEARLTEYPDLGHNCWDRAYGDPELPEWLLKHG